MNTQSHHFEDTVVINASAEAVFAYADDHKNFSSHMNKASWMMGGGKMETTVDKGEGKKIGSHIKMGGKVFGIELFLDEVVTKYEPPYKKVWQTVGDVKLLVIGHYTLGFEITPQKNGSNLKVFIDYELPSGPSKILGILFSKIYAKWCVNQMINGVAENFK